MDYRRKRDPRERVNIQGSLPPGSRIVHQYRQKIKQRGQEFFMYDQGSAGEKQEKKTNNHK